MREPGHHVEVLFAGMGREKVCWYRIASPALYLGCDWVGLAGEPPKQEMLTGYVKGATQMPAFEDYEIIVIQQPRGRGWFQFIQRLQSRGIIVLYEVDDYLHGIRKSSDHGFAKHHSKSELRRIELCMRACDGMIVATEYLARRYRRYNANVWVCPNGLDLGRYRLSRPARLLVDGKPSVCIGWAGATGHMRAIAPWLQPIEDLMARNDRVRFCSVGQDFASPFNSVFPGRGTFIPFGALETYPAAMTAFDIAIAPALDSSFHRAKSPLRALEAGALGIPVVADRTLYAEVVKEDETGFLVDTPSEAENVLEMLIRDDNLRLQMGDAARAHVFANYDMRDVVEHWRRALTEVYRLKAAA